MEWSLSFPGGTMPFDARRSRRLASLALAALLACIPDRDPPVLTIAIGPTAAQVEPGATLQFTATGNGAAKGVDWLVEGTGGGSWEAGTITPAGLYQAPAVSRAPVVVTCRSAEDPEVSASATVTFPPPPSPSHPPRPTCSSARRSSSRPR